VGSNSRIATAASSFPRYTEFPTYRGKYRDSKVMDQGHVLGVCTLRTTPRNSGITMTFMPCASHVRLDAIYRTTTAAPGPEPAARDKSADLEKRS
jgi:hypothetical protein